MGANSLTVSAAAGAHGISSKGGRMIATDGTPEWSTSSLGGKMTRVSNTPASRRRSQTSKSGGPNMSAPPNIERPPTGEFRICDTCPEPSCAGCPVKLDPARQARLEKEDRNTLRWLVVAAFCFTLVLGLFGVVEWQTHTVVASHNAELAQIETVVKHTAHSQANHYQTVKDIAAIVTALKADKGLVTLGTADGLADYQAICNAIPGCKLPYPSG